MPDKNQIQQSLYDFDATIKAKPNLTDKELLSKFPEFGNDINKLQAAKDYSVTLNSGKYKSVDEFNNKFPEFFSVEKKNSLPSPYSNTQLPSVLQEGNKMVGGNIFKDVSARQNKIEQENKQLNNQIEQEKSVSKRKSTSVIENIPLPENILLGSNKQAIESTKNVPLQISRKIEKPIDVDKLVEKLANTTTESEESIRERLDDGDLIIEDGKIKEKGNWLQNVGQGIKNTMDDISLFLNIENAKRKIKEGERTDDNELKYYLNQYKKNKENELETTYDAKGDFFKALPQEIGHLAPYMVAGYAAPMLDVPLMGMSQSGQNSANIWNNNNENLSEKDKLKAIKETSLDQFMIGSSQMAIFHGLGITNKSQAKELLSKYAPTSQLFNSSKNILSALPIQLGKVYTLGGAGQALSNVSNLNAGIDVDWKNVPEAAKGFVKMDLIFKAPQLFMAGLGVLNDARKFNVNKEKPDWFNKYNESVQEQLNAIVSSPENIYNKLISQLEQHPNEPLAIQAKQKIQQFRDYYNQLPNTLTDASKNKSLHLLQLKTDAIDNMNNVTEPSIKKYYEERAKSYDGQLQKIMEGTDKEPVKLLEYPKKIEETEEIEETKSPIVEGTKEEVIEPIGQLGTGSNVYFETNKYRVNDLQNGNIVLNIGDKNGEVPLRNVEFDNKNEAVFVAKKLEENAPEGLVSDYHNIDKIIDNYKKEYKESLIKPTEPTKQPTVSETIPELKDVESTAKALGGLDRESINNLEKLSNIYYHANYGESIIDGKKNKYGLISKLKDFGNGIHLGTRKQAEEFLNQNKGFLYKVKLSAKDIKKGFDEEASNLFSEQQIDELYNKYLKKGFSENESYNKAITDLATPFKYKNQIGKSEALKYINTKEGGGKDYSIVTFNPDFTKIVSAITIDEKGESIIFDNSIKDISESYHAAKADGSNPELVKAVEELLGKPKEEIKPTETEPTTELPTETRPETKISTVESKTEGGVSTKAEPITETTKREPTEIEMAYEKAKVDRGIRNANMKKFVTENKDSIIAQLKLENKIKQQCK